MSWEVLLNYTAKALVLPPGINIVLMLLAWLVWKKWRSIAVILFGVSLVTLYLFSMPFMANQLMGQLQSYPPLTSFDLQQAKENPEPKAAIVVLAAGRNYKAPEYGNVDTVNSLSLERLRYAAFLHKETGFPLLLSGGRVFGEGTPEAVLMNEVLINTFEVTPAWLETESNNSAQNALNSKKILIENQIETVYLVTHAWHMQRAIGAFEGSGLNVIPAPTSFVLHHTGNHAYLPYLPSASALLTSRMALHERVGEFWYSIRY